MILKTFIAISIYTLVHAWYPSWCCSDKDCEPVPCDTLIEDKDGNIDYIENGIKYKYLKERVFPSQDSKCHRCIYNGTAQCVFGIQSY